MTLHEVTEQFRKEWPGKSVSVGACVTFTASCGTVTTECEAYLHHIVCYRVTVARPESLLRKMREKVAVPTNHPVEVGDPAEVPA